MVDYQGLNRPVLWKHYSWADGQIWSLPQIDPLTCPVGNSRSHWRG